MAFPNNSSWTGEEAWNEPIETGDMEPCLDTSESARSMSGDNARAENGVSLEPPDSDAESNSDLEFRMFR